MHLMFVKEPLQLYFLYVILSWETCTAWMRAAFIPDSVAFSQTCPYYTKVPFQLCIGPFKVFEQVRVTGWAVLIIV
ncbi:hypothetical protein XELAEV_18026829mg [Xenopus laevis]|uniref:Uncharacterized protein n=1 Tax=Xenopus laevis TaxID=8355 RepID=A0A974HJD6_XENLA|nr:hypothetical protein XELAEV_18026829mg [Xenopus laevis]